MKRIQRRISLLIVAICTALAAAMSIMPAATAAPPNAPPSDPNAAGATVLPIIWTPCEDGFLCGQHRVPLDYDHPGGPQISLALVKIPATDPARRIGSLFVNPGGPGGSGVDFVRDVGARLFTPEVRARFDIVGFDPRGVIRSHPLRCFETLEDALDVWILPYPYPTTAAERRAWIKSDRAVNAACERRAGPIIDHMSTADVARDLDRLRQAVGDDKLTYYGISYGSMIGNTYANLFPGRFRALVIDGVLDPIRWTTGRGNEGRTVPLNTRLGGPVGAQATLQEFFRICDASGPRCAWAPNSSQRYAKLYRTLERHPVLLPGDEGSTEFDESHLVSETLGAMYGSDNWPAFAEFLVELETTANPARIEVVLQRLRRGVAADDYLNYVESFPGVACGDSISPKSYQAYDRAARLSRQRGEVFGQLWAWSSSICAEWPGRPRDRYLGPFNRRTDRPVLVVGNQFDPATPFRGAVAASRLLPNSRLLTVRAWGHTSLFRSTCADTAIATYLLTSKPPARGTVCETDTLPFADTATRTTAARAAGPAIRPLRPHQ